MQSEPCDTAFTWRKEEYTFSCQQSRANRQYMSLCILMDTEFRAPTSNVAMGVVQLESEYESREAYYTQIRSIYAQNTHKAHFLIHTNTHNTVVDTIITMHCWGSAYSTLREEGGSRASMSDARSCARRVILSFWATCYSSTNIQPLKPKETGFFSGEADVLRWFVFFVCFCSSN